MVEAILARVPQACEMLKCSKGTLYKRLKSGTIRSFKDGRVRKVEVASIHAYIQGQIASQGVGAGWGKGEE